MHSYSQDFYGQPIRLVALGYIRCAALVLLVLLDAAGCCWGSPVLRKPAAGVPGCAQAGILNGFAQQHRQVAGGRWQVGSRHWQGYPLPPSICLTPGPSPLPLVLQARGAVWGPSGAARED
jgi:hypothetical protein